MMALRWVKWNNRAFSPPIHVEGRDNLGGSSVPIRPFLPLAKSKQFPDWECLLWIPERVVTLASHQAQVLSAWYG